MEENEELLDEGTNSSEDTSEEQEVDWEINDNVDNDETETNEQKQKQEQKPKQKSWVPKLLKERNELKSRLEALEQENAFVKLQQKYGEFNQEEVARIKKEKNLSYEEAYALHSFNNPKPQQEQKQKEPNLSFQWGKPNLESKVITQLKLSQLSQKDYNDYMDKIEKWEILLKY